MGIMHAKAFAHGLAEFWGVPPEQYIPIHLKENRRYSIPDVPLSPNILFEAFLNGVMHGLLGDNLVDALVVDPRKLPEWRDHVGWHLPTPKGHRRKVAEASPEELTPNGQSTRAEVKARVLDELAGIVTEIHKVASKMRVKE